jgi:hypothetical protein
MLERAELEDMVTERTPLTAHVGKSGAGLERWVLHDGGTLIVKRLVPDLDFLMALTHDTSGRELTLWQSGLLDHLPEGVEHAIVGGWREGEGALLVMRDLADTFLTWDDRLDEHRCRWLMGRLAALHRSGAELSLDPWKEQLTPLPDYLTMFSPTRVRALVGKSPLPELSLRGWELFQQTVGADVAGPVVSLLHDPAPLVTALRRRPSTLVHGDFVVVNMALAADVLTLVDWSVAGAAPGALDVARFLAGCSAVVDLTREQTMEAYAVAAGSAFDEPALRLALLAGLVWLGWNKALDAHEHPDAAIREREREDLDWWVGQARTTLGSGLL